MTLAEIKMNRILQLLANYIDKNPEIAYDVLDMLMQHLKAHPELVGQLFQAIIARSK